MPCINNMFDKKSIRTFFYLMCCIAFGITIFSSCKQKKTPAGTGNLGAFYDRVNYLYDINPKNGMHFLDSAFAKQPNADFVDHFHFYYQHYLYSYAILKDYSKAMLYTDTMLTMVQKTNDETKYAKQFGMTYFSKGDLYFLTNKFPEAYQYYYKGKMIGRNNFDNCTMGDYSYHMGMIMYKQEYYKLAASNFKQSVEETSTCADGLSTYYRIQETLDNVGICYRKADMPDSAAIYFNKALEYIDKGASKYLDKAKRVNAARAVVYGNQANLYIQQKNIQKAKELLIKSFEINLQPRNDTRDAELSELKLAHIYADENNTTALLTLLNHVRDQLDSVKNITAEADWNYMMASYYREKNNDKQALNHFIKYNSIKDSITKINLKLKENNVNQQFRDFENQSTISTLKGDNELQQIYLTVSVVYAVMALLIILLIFSNWKRSRNNVKILSELNLTVTDQKEKLQTSLHELEENSHEKDRILRAVSHDLRNPIGGIASLTALMLMEPNLDSEQLELLELIKTTTDNSLELINEILEATEVLSSKGLSKQKVDINMLLSHSVELLKFKAAEKNQKIKLSLLERAEELHISREKIWRVLSNLISNAIKFSAQGSEIEVKVVTEQNRVKISVADHGIGIPVAMRDKVFHMFTEAKRPGTSGEKSFGLGLSISKQIIESHGGEIWFESLPDNGTTFYITLNKVGA